MRLQSTALQLAAIAAGLMVTSAAQAGSTAPLNPLTGNTSGSENWRFTPGQTFNGVAGALDGVARITFATPGGAVYGCSGSLLAGGQYVLTAAHCADSFTQMVVEFGVVNDVAAVTRTVSVSNAYVHPAWNGSLDTGADIAVLKLSQPVTTIQGYHLSTTNDVGKEVLVAGYGTTSVASSNTPANWLDGAWGHYGYNTFDVDSKTFNAEIENTVHWGYDPAYYAPGTTYMSDYDDGTAAHNTLARIDGLVGGSWTSSTGLGANEALIAGGDSGGGDFVFNGTEWLLSGVHSWGWSGEACLDFGLSTCDANPNNNSSFGDMSGSTATYSHIGWINSVTAVPEPATYGMMLSGLALVGAVARRRRQSQA